ncbi:AAA family ATPase [Bordetella sp. BOR01]|uniref:AAA family ATPase n=1 Tax=Bordetella sp. BOR01 TaxID=2854779 RepID=UPI001C48D3A0|nr:AAA family ATPase [Bordetella sp. BOR01]MBV7486036.1 AAA family ATPase [Bordetella sp. BOR01]
MHPSLIRPIQLRLLGEFDIAVANVSGRRALSYSKPKLLLAMLALAQGKPYSRAELANTLWPADLKDGRANLRHALFVLRRLFEPVPDAWISTSSTLALNPDVIMVDVLAIIGAAGYEDLTPEQRLNYDRGSLLEYTDLPESGSFTAWKTSWQSRIERDVSERRKALLAQLTASGHLNQALDTAKHWVHTHPEDEGAHRHLIRLLLDNGNREAALLAYQHCVGIMRERYDTEPTEQTRALVENALPALEPDMLQPVEQRQYCPLAVLAVALTLDESERYPEQSLQGLQTARKHLLELARSEGGHVLVGADNSLAIVFGYPKLTERPAHAAAKLACGIRALSLPTGVRVGMGIHADISLVQSNTRPDAGALVSQRAMRLAYLADTCEILLSAATRDRLADQFAVRAEKRHGRHLCLLEFQLEAKVVRRMFGRVREFDSLVRLWARLPVAQLPTAMTVRGEAGIGKSLLMGVMAEYVRHTGGDICLLACHEGHDNTPFYPVREYIMQRLSLEWGGIDGALDSSDYQRQLVETVCQRVGLDSSVHAGLRRVLFPEGDRAGQAAASDLSRQALMQSLLSILAHRSQPDRPLLLVWEDLHWADHSSLALLQLLMKQVQAAPTMALMTAREEFGGSAWSAHELLLKPLERQAIAELVAHRAKGQRLSSKLRARIVDDADGIPLYAEEMVRQVVLGADIGVTPVIADLIAARLSDLEPGTRRLAQFAAVAGQVDDVLMARAAQEFNVNPQSMPEVLAELRQRGLIDDAIPANFRHALVRDAIYHTLSPGQRRLQHEIVANYLIEQSPRSEPVESAYIARHLEMAQHARASEWWCLAARDALAQSAVAEAQALTERALRALRHIEDVQDRRKNELEVQLLRGSVFASLKGGGAAETSEAYARTIELQQSNDDPNTQFLLLWGAWTVAISTRTHAESLQQAERIYRYAEQTSDSALQGWAQYACGFSYLLTGDMVAAERWLRTCIQSLGGQPDQRMRFARWGADGVCAAKAVLGWVLTLQGREEEGLAFAKAGLADANNLDHLASRVLCLAMLGEIHRQRGDDDEALEAADTLRAQTNSGDFALWRGLAEGLSGWVRARRGERSGLDSIQRAIDASRAGMPVLQSALELFLASAHLEHDEPERASGAVQRAAEVMERFGSQFMRGDYLFLLGNVAARQGQYGKAREHWQEAVTESRRLGLTLVARRAQARLKDISQRVA